MKRALRTAAAVSGAILFVLAAAPAGAQTKAGTTLGQFLGIEPSARTAAMGNAAVALDDGIESVYYNPAVLGSLTEWAFAFTYSAWYADINYNYVAGSLPFTWGTLFGSVTALNSGEIDVRTVAQPLGTGERYTVSNVALGLGYGRHITDRFTAGGQVNYVNERIWNSSADMVTFSLGTVYTLARSGFRIGASMSNIGTSARYDGRDIAIQYDNTPDVYGDNSALPGQQLTDSFPVPVLFRVGVAYPHRVNDENEVTFLADALVPNDNTQSMSFGGEWNWRQTLSFRLGYQNLFQTDSETGLTFGAGVHGGIGDNRFYFDYARATHQRLEGTHRVTLGIEF